MLFYQLAIAVFLLFAAFLLVTVNWYTALVSVGISLAMFFIMQARKAEMGGRR